MPAKTTKTSATRRRTSAAKTAVAKPPVRRREGWKKVLERNLIREGFSPAEAKELVAISAA